MENLTADISYCRIKGKLLLSTYDQIGYEAKVKYMENFES